MFSSFACYRYEVPLRSCEVTQPESQPCGQGSQTPNHHCWGQRRKHKKTTNWLINLLPGWSIWMHLVGYDWTCCEAFQGCTTHPVASSTPSSSHLPRTRCSLWPLPGRKITQVIATIAFALRASSSKHLCKSKWLFCQDNMNSHTIDTMSWWTIKSEWRANCQTPHPTSLQQQTTTTINGMFLRS